MLYYFFWIMLSIIVGVAANTRHRSPIGWSALAMLISPLLAGLLLLALPHRQPPAKPAYITIDVPAKRENLTGQLVGAGVLVALALFFAFGM